MIVQTEPNGFMMVRYKLYFNQQCPDPEDPWVFGYLREHHLEPRRRLGEEHDGVPYQVLHFGQCYLGRHLGALGNLYQRGIEHTVLAQHIQKLLSHADDAEVHTAVADLQEETLSATAAQLAEQLHPTAHFTAEEHNLRVTIDAVAVRQAFLALPTSMSAGNRQSM